MNEFPRWKYVLVVVVLLLGVLYGVPNLYVQQPAVQINANRGATVDDALKERVQGVLEKQKIGFESIESGDGHMLVRLPIGESELQAKAQEALRSELGDQYVVALNLASTVPDWMRAIGAREMPKGLDLQGGVHFLMEVDAKDVVEKQLQRFADDIRSALRERDIRYQSVGRGPQGLVVQLRSEADRDAALTAIVAAVPDVEVRQGAQVGEVWTLNANVRPEKIREISQNTIRQNVATLSNRINALGVAEPLIQQQGESRIAVELPGVQDTAEAKKTLGAQATLEYRAVDEGADAFAAMRSGQIPPEDKLYYRRERGPDGKPVPILLRKKIIVSGDEMVDATSAPDPQSGTPSVSVVLNSAGGRKMLDFTTTNVGKPMAVVYIERTPEVRMVDGKEVRSTKVTEEVISVANIRGVFSNRFQTTGLGSNEEASELALLLRSGSLAAPIDIVEERVIGPSLGKDNIQKG
ncbi:MAG TPA: preprotein translocase subunit SecD, partial [Dokdonella sp.]